MRQACRGARVSETVSDTSLHAKDLYDKAPYLENLYTVEPSCQCSKHGERNGNTNYTGLLMGFTPGHRCSQNALRP